MFRLKRKVIGQLERVSGNAGIEREAKAHRVPDKETRGCMDTHWPRSSAEDARLFGTCSSLSAKQVAEEFMRGKKRIHTRIQREKVGR